MQECWSLGISYKIVLVEIQSATDIGADLRGACAPLSKQNIFEPIKMLEIPHL